MKESLSGKVVLITGPARGIGAETARALARRGARLALVGLEPELLRALADELGGGHVWFECDVTEQTTLERAVEDAVRALGRVDVVVANAGIACNRMVAAGPVEALVRTIEVNLVGVVRTVAATLPHVVEARGYYLLVSSAAALAPMPGLATYAAAKSGVEQFGNVLRLELAHKGVAVGVAHPCWIATDMVNDARRDLASFRAMLAALPWPFNSVTSVEACAAAFADGIERRKRKIYVPRALAPLAAVRSFFASPLAGYLIGRDARRLIPEAEREAVALGRPFGAHCVETKGRRAEEGGARESIFFKPIPHSSSLRPSVSRLWHMNADFETELAAPAGKYRRAPASVRLNRRLAPHLLRLARPGDALLLEEPWPLSLQAEARRRGVELASPEGREPQTARTFTPWGWTESAVAAGERAGAVVRPVPLDVVRRVNSKLWSHALEVELGVALPGAALASTIEELRGAIARACPAPGDKWVVKSPYGFAARERVLGRGPEPEHAQARWCERRLARGETLVFQPWLSVVREYGVVAEIDDDGSFVAHGVSDLQTNGAGTGTGYLLGRRPAPERLRELTRVAALACRRLRAEGYAGPVGVDALEHAGGLHPLLEINARYTMGFVALAVERALRPAAPTFWSTKEGMMNDE